MNRRRRLLESDIGSRKNDARKFSFGNKKGRICVSSPHSLLLDKKQPQTEKHKNKSPPFLNVVSVIDFFFFLLFPHMSLVRCLPSSLIFLFSAFLLSFLPSTPSPFLLHPSSPQLTHSHLHLTYSHTHTDIPPPPPPRHENAKKASDRVREQPLLLSPSPTIITHHHFSLLLFLPTVTT